MSKTEHRRPRGRKKFAPNVREKVILAATQTIEAGGLEGLKARAVARRSGISVGSIYNLFGGLDELIRIVNGRTYDDLYKVTVEALESSRGAGQSPRAQMSALAAAYLGFVETHQACWQAVLAFNRARQEPPPLWYLQKELALLSVIEDSIAPFPGAADAGTRQLIARALWASIHGIVTIAVADGFHMQPLGTVKEQIQIIVNAVAMSLEADVG